MENKIEVSVVVPIYGCAVFLEELVSRLNQTFSILNVSHEIILVDDRSEDGAWQIIRELSVRDCKVKGIRLSRNFGQQYAILAGLRHVNGNWCVVMDGDLQDQPEEIIKLYNKAKEGYDIVMGLRKKRKDGFIKKVTSRIQYLLLNYLSGMNLDNRSMNFGILSKKVVEKRFKYKEKDISLDIFTEFVGFKKIKIELEHSHRPKGESSYTFQKRLEMATGHLLANSNKPLFICIKIGFLISILSFLYAAFLFIRFFIYKHIVTGWTSLMVSLYLSLGLLIIVIGILGLYIEKIYSEVKARPLYIIDEVTF